MSIHEFESIDTELAWLVQKARHARRKMAFLYRTQYQGRFLEQELLSQQIPYEMVGGQQFEHRAQVEDLLSYLRFVHNPQDRLSFERIINVPRRGISHRTVLAVYEAMELVQTHDVSGGLSVLSIACRLAEGDIIHGVCVSEKVRPILQSFVKIVSALLHMKRNLSSAVDMLHCVIDTTNYHSYLEEVSVYGHCNGNDPGGTENSSLDFMRYRNSNTKPNP